ncbi:SMI1/KNR4 family protein [Frateuria defendens]|uniref:SMI1/KNR4 family protein n=1 Tax=Frateuria defendens TaxID=2219559 RepID=UPI0012935301|nr:SMI1/KNR4 family protein [Frateuria defendens]
MSNREHWSNWALNGPVAVESLRSVESALGRHLPHGYRDFLQKNDGGEGFISDNYVILWRAEELIEFNREYEVEKYAPGLFLFGSDGGGEGYGFDMREQDAPVVMVPFIGMSLRYARPIAPSFADFLRRLEDDV